MTAVERLALAALTAITLAGLALIVFAGNHVLAIVVGVWLAIVFGCVDGFVALCLWQEWRGQRRYRKAAEK